MSEGLCELGKVGYALVVWLAWVGVAATISLCLLWWVVIYDWWCSDDALAQRIRGLLRRRADVL